LTSQKKVDYEEYVPYQPKEEKLSGIPTVLKYAILGLICLIAFSIRLFAVVRYESVIHEFDPYFNFRTTKYLAHEGFLNFLDWFDDRGWYPLGRTIGGTIYPGLMFTSASIYWVLNFFNITINIRNMCVFLAPIFSSLSAIASYLLTKEVTKRSSTGLLAAAFTAIVPSYISRSVGGSYDNEGVAIFALIFVFYLWVKSVHTGSLFYACLTALAYFYMVAAWGGYVFIINIIPIYTTLLILGGKYSSRLYIAYSTFYVLGSLLAMQVPFVGFNVVNQAECAASHGVFILVQVYALVDYLLRVVDKGVLKRLFLSLALLFVGGVAFMLISLQMLGKVQWTGRSLSLLDPTYASRFIPIIASVAEHQPTTWTSFFFDLNVLVPLAPVGLYFLFQKPSEGGIFVILYGTVAWYFAGVMVRLMLTLAPIACILGAIGFSTILRKFSAILQIHVRSFRSSLTSSKDEEGKSSSSKEAKTWAQAAKNTLGLGPTICILSACGFLLSVYLYHSSYAASVAYSSPSIVIDAGRTRDGRRIMYDDYREAYYWLRQNTHEDAKIMSWWDYGYQMSAMANRTVLVDNNTWNNTHIATVGRALASTEEKAYPILESLEVDYVLVIFGGVAGYSSDDINKFLWPVRIGSGVFPNDMPHERDFYSASGFDVGIGGSPALLNCVAYKLCYHRFGELMTEYGKPPGYDRTRQKEIGNKAIYLETMEEAFTSEHWIVRIYKVKKRPIFDSLTSSSPYTHDLNHVDEQKEQRRSQQDKQAEVEAQIEQRTRYVGCFNSEAAFSSDKIYGGGGTGANFNLALHHALTNHKRYFAVARHGGDGHSFSFATLQGSEGGNSQDKSCRRPCLDYNKKACGCSDDACEDPLPAGEEHNRRWAVYEVVN
jgi:dolichyl-diphosphooligosaccharide--protein glycosyltransferase